MPTNVVAPIGEISLCSSGNGPRGPSDLCLLLLDPVKPFCPSCGAGDDNERSIDQPGDSVFGVVEFLIGTLWKVCRLGQ